ncbi:MAG: toll/interleukin-1 receptor domain-containing protein [Clostridiales bacterium]|nr:toll/interleukin-1 receptor domain-containing protein [Clostridiales bacterium]
MVIPKTYLERDGKKNQKYFFISYSHGDKEIVYHVLSELYEKGGNFWYDIELSPGDCWDEKVAEHIRNENCVGAIFFISIKNTSTSAAMYEEVEIVNELSRKRKFTSIPVYIDYFKDDVLKQLQLALISNNSVENELNMKMAAAYTNLFSSRKIYVLCSEVKYAADQLYESCIRCEATEFNPLNIKEENFQFLSNVSKVDSSHILKDGIYPQTEDGLPVEWKLVYKESENLYFVSKYCLDFVPKGDKRCENSLANQFSGKPYIEKVGLIKRSLIEKVLAIKNGEQLLGYNVPTDYADSMREQQLKLFWVENDDETLSLFNMQNKEIKSKLPFSDINAGVRLMLIINDKKVALQEEEKNA